MRPALGQVPLCKAAWRPGGCDMSEMDVISKMSEMRGRREVKMSTGRWSHENPQ